jgi:hypothetical protein
MAEVRISIVGAVFLAAMLPVAVSPQPVQAARSPGQGRTWCRPRGQQAGWWRVWDRDEKFWRLPSPAVDRRAVPEPRPDAVLVRWRPAADAAARARDLRTAGGRAVAALPGGWTVVRGNASTLRERLRRAGSVARVEPDLRRRAAGEDVLYDKAQRSALEAVRWPEARTLARDARCGSGRRSGRHRGGCGPSGPGRSGSARLRRHQLGHRGGR